MSTKMQPETEPRKKKRTARIMRVPGHGKRARVDGYQGRPVVMCVRIPGIAKPRDTDAV